MAGDRTSPGPLRSSPKHGTGKYRVVVVVFHGGLTEVGFGGGCLDGQKGMFQPET